MMTAVERFLRDGELPFVGREAEIGKILDLWRSSVDSGRLRGLLMIAEAGAGKSRILQEAIGRVEEEGGVVVHVKLYPEATNDLAALLAGALDRSRTSLSGDLVDGVAALRKLSRLRRTLLVIEDIHLMSEEGLADLDVLFRGLADETLAFVAAARPVDLRARGLLEPYLASRLDVEGLSVDAVVRLWQELFGGSSSSEPTAILHRCTHGNPLALRSALRGAIEGGVVAERSAGEWQVTDLLDHFESVVEQSIALVVEGIFIGLSREVRKAAAAVATLGEIVARESAERLVGTSTLEALIDHHLLVATPHSVAPQAAGRHFGVDDMLDDSTPAIALAYPASRRPLLSFTHSLVQSVLEQEAEGDTSGLLSVIADHLPIYSVTPFLRLREYPVPETIDREVLINATSRTMMAGQGLDRTSAWRDAGSVFDAVDPMIEQLTQRFPGRTADFWRLRLIVSRLSMHNRRSIGSPTWRRLLEEGRELAEANIDDYRLAYGLLFIAATILPYDSRTGRIGEVIDRTDRMVDAVITSHPRVVLSPGYVSYLDAFFFSIAQVGETELLIRSKRRADELIENPELSEEMRIYAIHRLYQYFLSIIETDEDVAEQRRMLEKMDLYRDAEVSFYEMKKCWFLLEVGDIAEARSLSIGVGLRSREIGTWLNYYNCCAVTEIGGALLEYDRAGLIDRSLALLEVSVPERFRHRTQAKVFAWMHAISLLTGDHALFTQFVERSGVDFEPSDAMAALVALTREKRDGLAVLTDDEYHPSRQHFISSDSWDSFRTSLEADLAEEKGRALLPVLDRKVVTLTHAASILVAIRFALTFDLLPVVRDVAIAGLERVLDWIEQKGARAMVPAVLEIARRIDAGPVVERIDAGADGRRQEAGGEKEGDAGVARRTRISMIGTIRIALPGEEFAQVRGVRIRTILGLMIADELLERSLDAEEFTKLAGGGDPDHVRARKKKNMGVVRLREIMGRDAILTDGPTPRLDRTQIDVDLLDVADRLAEAERAVTDGSIVRSRLLLLEIFSILGTDVPFPTLYDDFFEAVRGDLERRIRSVLIATARALLDGKESDLSVELLRSGIATMPGDDELEDLLGSALEYAGEKAEAARVGLGRR